MERAGLIRYPLPIPEWNRTIWATAEDRTTWEPRIQAITRAWAKAEVASVGQFRDAALIHVEEDALPALSLECATKGTIAVPLDKIPTPAGYQSKAGGGPTLAGRFSYRTVVCLPAVAATFAAAFRAGDNATMGRLLGFPACCIDFFDRVWTREQWMDTTWPYALNSVPDRAIDPPGMLDATLQDQRIIMPIGLGRSANMLWRWLGVRQVTHLPCRWDCQGTRDRAGDFAALLHQLAPDAAGWQQDFLGMPASWSAWHGIGEIASRICKVSVKTDATAQRLILDWPGVPDAQPLPVLGLSDKHDWRDNGFQNRAAMQDAHDWLIGRMMGDLKAQGLDRLPGPILDLGCGNGELMARLATVYSVEAVGIESDRARANRGLAKGRDIRPMDIKALQALPSARNGQVCQVVLVSNNRWRPDEMQADDVRRIKTLLLHAKVIVQYSYETREIVIQTSGL